jgi:hypothetical protein
VLLHNKVKIVIKDEKGFSLVELAIAAAAAVTIGAIAVTVSTGTSAAISSKARTGKTTADTYNSSVVYNPDIAVTTAPTITYTNLITNPSFTVDMTDWVGNFATYRTTSIFRSTPASLTSYLDADGSPPFVQYYKSNATSYATPYSFSAWIRNPSESRAFAIQFIAGGTLCNTTTAIIPASTSWQYIKVENCLSGGSGTLMVSASPLSGTTEFQIDDVAVVQGATAQ